MTKIFMNTSCGDYADVADLESADLNGRSIQQDVSLRRGDEKRTDTGRADVMDVADEAKRFERRVPRLPFLLIATFSAAFFSAKESSAKAIWVARQASNRIKFRFTFIIAISASAVGTTYL
jgi:hypothetical protein